jgi:beta-galactosidase/beta-glucuronidase
MKPGTLNGVTISIALLLLGLPFRALTADWKIAEASLLTPWAERVDPKDPLPEYPRPVMERADWLNLNGVWEFQEAQAGDAVPVGQKLDGVILVPFPWESALSGVRKQFDSRRAWYRREFNVPASWSGKRVLLHFGAVDWEATVYVNGRSVGAHRGGYDAFSFDITSFLKREGSNELIVSVFDPGTDTGIAVGKQSNERFADPQRYTYCPASGIWQTVWLEPVPGAAILDLHSVPDIDRETLTVTVNTTPLGTNFSLQITALDGGMVVSQTRGPPNQPIILPVKDPKLWSPTTPHLYDLRVELKQGDATHDEVKSYFGMRKIAIQRHVINGRDGLMKLELNNEFVFQFGPLDQGYWPDGIYTAPTDEALRWDIEQIKAWGCNLVRKHVKVESQRWYYWCDRLGLLVWQDMPSTFKKRTEEEKTQFETELQRLIKGRWNHPAIVNWIVFNEHWGAYDVERLTEMVMALDPSRVVTGNTGMDAGRPHIDYEVGHIKSNHRYRPPTNPMANNRRAAVNGEFGAIGYLLDGHVWDTDGPWVHYNYQGKEDATVEYEKFLAQLHKYRDEDHLSGAVYTQLTDIENEMNGFFTYDRKVEKLDRERVTKANRALWAGDLKESKVVNPTDGGALTTPDEGPPSALRKREIPK